MRLSNKILLGFLGFIFLYLTAAFTELRLSGIPNNIDDKNSIAETVDISGVAYVILNDLNKDVNIIGSDRPRIELRSLTGDWLKNLEYEISGDTLTLSGFQSEKNRRVRISVFVASAILKGITVDSSFANVKGLQQELLHLSQNNGRIWMSDNRIAKVQIDVSNESYLDISTSNLDTLSVNIEGSEAHINSRVGFLQGSIKNKAFLLLNNVQEIQLKKDESSRLNMYQ